MLIMTGVGAYLAQESRMHALATCVCAHVVSEKKGAMVYVTRNHTMERTMRVENAACVSRLCSADMQEALATCVAKRRPDCQVAVFVSAAWPLGPCALFALRGIQRHRWTLCLP